jgi:uncharacterized LabA/DUF88 family protein
MNGFRVRIFIDFWNFQLGMQEYDSSFRLDWRNLPEILVKEAVGSGQPGSYEGACVYASINPKSENDLKLKNFLLNTVNRMPGYEIKIYERKPASAPRCQECHQDILSCPHCKAVLKRQVEKGIDTGIVTDMLQHAWDDTYDYGVLLSADADFIPAVVFLNRRGKKIVHASFTSLGQNLANQCWKQVNLTKFATLLQRHS